MGPPTEIYDNPATPFVYQFIGNSNRFDCQVINGHVSISGHVVGAAEPGLPNGPALAFIRPHDFDIRLPKGGLGLPATVRHVFAAGTLLRIELRMGGTEQIVEVEVDRALPTPDLSPGRDVVLSPRAIKVFPRGLPAVAEASQHQSETPPR